MFVQKMRINHVLLKSIFFALLLSMPSLISAEYTPVKADGENVISLHDFNIKSGAYHRGASLGGTEAYSTETNNKFIKFNYQLLQSPKDNTEYTSFYIGAEPWEGIRLDVRDSGFSLFNDTFPGGDEKIPLIASYNFPDNIFDNKITVNFGLDISYDNNHLSCDVYIDDELVCGTNAGDIHDIDYDVLGGNQGNIFLMYSSVGVKIWDINDEEPILEDPDKWIKTDGVTSKHQEGFDYPSVNIKNIEDFIADDVGCMILNTGTTRTEQDYIRLDDSAINNDNVRANVVFRGKGNNKFTYGYGVKFNITSEYLKSGVGGKFSRNEVYIEFSSSSSSTGWSSTGAAVISFIYDINENLCRIVFYPNGISSGNSHDEGGRILSYPLNHGISTETGFRLNGEKEVYTLMAGVTFNDQGQYVMFLEASANVGGVIKNIYGQCIYDGDYLFDHLYNGGYFRIVKNSISTCSPFEIRPVDQTKNLYENYQPEFVEPDSSYIKTTDVAELLPIGKDGVTYRVDNKDESHPLNIINTEGLLGNTSLETYMMFKGNYNLRLAFFTDRSNNQNAISGYHAIFTPHNITLLSYSNHFINKQATVNYQIKENEKLHVRFLFENLEIGGVPQSYRLSVFIQEQLIIREIFEKQAFDILPDYFDGLLYGDGEISIYPYSSDYDVAENIITLDCLSELGIDESIKLKYKSLKKVLSKEKVIYEIVKGQDVASIYKNARGVFITGLKNGTCEVRAKITNEYGTFDSEIFVFTVGTGIYTPNPLPYIILGIAGLITLGSVITIVVLTVRRRKHV